MQGRGVRAVTSLLNRINLHTKLLAECSALGDVSGVLTKQASDMLYHAHTEHLQEYVATKGMEATGMPTPDVTSLAQEALFKEMKDSILKARDVYTNLTRVYKILQDEE